MAVQATPFTTYVTTHPWIRFSAEFMTRAQGPLWIMLGECGSKCEHIAGVPLRPQTAERLHLIYLAKGALATTAIEGNTLSEKDVLDHLEGKLKLPPSQEYLAQEITNVVVGCNSIAQEVRSLHRLDLSADRIRELNRIVLDKLTLEQGVVAGDIRQHNVTVGRYRGAPAADCGYLLDRLCTWLSGPDFTPPDGLTIHVAILKAILAHLYLAWIHPFGDGNGRTARLVEFQILIASGVPAPAAHLLSNHYNQTRTQYYRELDQASRSGGDVLPFIAYAVQGFRDGLRSQLAFIREQQWTVAWENYVHDSFAHQTGETQARRRTLVLDLTASKNVVPPSKIPELSPRLATAYAGRTKRTLERDINALERMGLVAREKDGIRAKNEQILAFLPIKADKTLC